MSKYILSLKKVSCRLRVTYRDGKFHSLEKMSGNVTVDQHDALMRIVPQKEIDFDYYKDRWKDSVTYSKQSQNQSDNLYASMLVKYKNWYYLRHEVGFMMDGIGGKSLKQIITKLKKLSSDDDEILTVWNLILDGWDKQEAFYRSQDQLKQINSNLNTILTVIKNGKSAQKTKGADGVANLFRK